MSAPDGDLEKQSKHHRGPLNGMFAVVLFIIVLFGALAFWAFGRGGDPEGATAQVQEGTGTVESGQANDAITANDYADEESNSAAATRSGADPSAVQVQPQIVTNPQTGMDEEQNPITGQSDAAQPLNPVEGSGAPAVQGNE